MQTMTITLTEDDEHVIVALTPDSHVDDTDEDRVLSPVEVVAYLMLQRFHELGAKTSSNN